MSAAPRPVHSVIPAAAPGADDALRIADEQDTRQFIARVFANHYNARVDTFCNQLMAQRDKEGRILAAAGYNLAEEGPLFLEQYLGMPVEEFVKDKLGLDLTRSDLVEVGNLATVEAGGARQLIAMMTRHLHKLGQRWVVFTATRQLINSFQRMGLSPIPLQQATPDRVRNPENWGRYYDQQPWVVLGNIGQGFAHLENLASLTPPELLQ